MFEKLLSFVSGGVKPMAECYDPDCPCGTYKSCTTVRGLTTCSCVWIG
ncbi:hypothetical protein [Heyndrickxia sporothermodurans]|nr:hypothetical protein [Heyndrickxia sporothermodurans]MBL5769073.1 hypothetical protein [Heyndrickxia sporothermodurans]MBL5772792.1 hypothetical protein [Heyndrickxia sporothermodurans]MBL5776214.1 hypothetical protein [Heyndrickxia sporothermodurans]MBL5786954.1 hypothetical protein [Heyndrickxia sporothermodurans]MBL5790497.1 hypothetical protein [Heyndrickxia sporothermodurans]